MFRAMARLSDEVARCLRPGDGEVLVEGAFDGTTGHFHAERLVTSSGAALPYAVETCVRAVAARAHVRPFRDERARYAYRFLAPPAQSTTLPTITTLDAGVTSSSPLSMSAAPDARSPFLPPDETAMALIQREAPAFQRCYEEQALARDDTVEGTITLHLVLDARGSIVRLTSEVHSRHPDPTLMALVARCIEQRVREIAFGPQPDSGAEIVVPLTFRESGVPTGGSEGH